MRGARHRYTANALKSRSRPQEGKGEKVIKKRKLRGRCKKSVLRRGSATKNLLQLQRGEVDLGEEARKREVWQSIKEAKVASRTEKGLAGGRSRGGEGG